jgi:hypothetical protein
VTRTEKARLRQQNALAIQAIYAKRVAAGVCRHCGGPVPCWSDFGDAKVGVWHTKRSLTAMRKA